MDTTKQTTNNDAGYGVNDVINDLGVRVLTKEQEQEVERSVATTALAEYRSAPTLKGLGRDHARVAATTSENPEGARVSWQRRQLMELNKDGKITDAPIFQKVAFTGADVVIAGVPDVKVSAVMEIEGLGNIEIQPLFAVVPPEMQYVYKTEDGRYVPTRTFSGTLFQTKDRSRDGDLPIYKFVPIEFADESWIDRWNGIVEQGKQTGTIHGTWPTISKVAHTIGKRGQRLLTYSPKYQDFKEFPRMHRGRPVKRDGKVVMDKQWRIGTMFGKIVVLKKSQYIPTITEGEKVRIDSGPFVFFYTEREKCIEVTLIGRPGEVNLDLSLSTISEVGDEMNPFQVLNTTVERFTLERTKEFVDTCLKRPIDKENPLYVRALELGLVIEGQPRQVARVQLQELAREALYKAKVLWDEAMSATWKNLERFELPNITECLAGNTLKDTLKRLNDNDVAAAWLTSHIEGEYMHTSPFHRVLRSWVLKASAEKVGYSDPKPEPEKAEQPKESTGDEPGDNFGNLVDPQKAKTNGKPKDKKSSRKPRTRGGRTPKPKVDATATASV